MRCPTCQSELPARARFCPECGGRLAEAESTAPPLGAPAPGAAAPNPPSAAEERRQVTVLFADLVGSVAHADRMDPEDWRETLARYHAAAAAAVERFGGQVTQYLGDGVLACFGYPRAHEDAPERAVRAGLALVEAVRELAAGESAFGAPAEDAAPGSRAAGAAPRPGGVAQAAEAAPRLRLRVGIHTGLTVVADAGGQVSVFGDTPNLAARVQGQAEPESVLVTAATHARVEGRFVVEPRGAPALKGVRESIELFRVLRPCDVRNTSVIAARRLAPLVGREAELGALGEAWKRARARTGQTVLVRSEPGVGKSRLLYELRRGLATEPHVWLECRCRPYAQGSALRPFAELLEEALGFAAADAPAAKLAKLAAQLRERKLPAEPMLPLLAEFLGLPPAAGYQPSAQSAHLKRFGLLGAIGRWLLRISEEQPLLLLIEDLHWCDPSSLELFERLVEEATQARLLLVGTARPEFVPGWSGREGFATLDLARLADAQAREFVARLDPLGSLPEGAAETLVARAEGVPLYLEELTRAVLEGQALRGAGASAAEIPATLQDSLAARLDRLSSAREVAQRVAVLGREFGFELAAASADLDEASLRAGLARLVEADIVIQQGEAPAARYQFRHALLQEAAYASLLRRTRRELHGRVVDALLARFPQQAEEAPELVAQHAEAAGRADTAVDHYERAGRRAQERSANEEAIAQLRRALALVEALAPEGREGRELALQLELGAALTGARGYAHPERQAAFERARALAERAGDATQLGRARIGVAISLFTRGEIEPARALSAAVLADAEKDGARELALHGSSQLAQSEYHQGLFASALAHCERALSLYDPEQHHRALFSIGGDTGISALGLSSWTLWSLGFPERALERVRAVYELAERFGYPFGLGYATGTRAVLHWMRREFAEQREIAARQMEIGDTYGFPFWHGVGQALHGAARVVGGDATGMAEALQGMARSAQTGARNGLPMMLALLADMQRAVGAPAQALGTVESALAIAAETGQPYWNPELLRGKAELLRVLRPEGDEPPEARARACYEEALRLACAQEARLPALRAATSLARWLQEDGRRDEARARLAPAYEALEEGFELADLREAKALLHELGA